MQLVGLESLKVPKWLFWHVSVAVVSDMPVVMYGFIHFLSKNMKNVKNMKKHEKHENADLTM